MRNVVLLIGVLICQLLYAQIPELKIYQKGKKKSLEIAKLSVDVEVIGNVAVTTFDVLFKNNLSVDLEGELTLALSDGQEISRYALDINGTLREGVIIEKVKARQAFEAIVRRKVDPGIANLTKGNTFKTKIYPIPRKGTKRVVLAISETLKGDEDNMYYSLPMGMESPIGEFNLKVNIVKGEVDNRLVHSDFENIRFDNAEDVYSLNYNRKNYQSKQPIKFTVPRFSQSDYQLFTCDFEGETYFYLNVKPPTLNSKSKIAIRNPVIYWDNSHSAASRDLKKELNFLKEYLRGLTMAEKVSLIVFNTSSQPVKIFDIATGTDDLIEYIQSLQPDGATNLEALRFESSYDEILLFSDAINTIGTEYMKLPKCPVYTITSSSGSNYSLLKSIAAKSNGEFIDLAVTSSADAVRLTNEDEEKFLSYTYNHSDIKAIYPTVPRRVNGYFEVVGILKDKQADLTINYGYKKGATQQQNFELVHKKNSSIARVWASKKIAQLSMNYDENKETIFKLGQRFNIVTRNTSFIVLDRVADYVQYEIVPPNELKDEYFRLLKDQVKEKKVSKRAIHRKNLNVFSSLMSWYRSTYKQPEYLNYKSNVTQIQSMDEEDMVIEFTADDEALPPPPVEVEDNDEIMNEIVLEDESPQIERDNTGGQVVTREEFSALPVRSIAASTAGVSQRDGDGEVNVRGGRDGQTVYYVDGVKMVGDASIPGMRNRGVRNKSSIKVLPWIPNASYLNKLRRADPDELHALYYDLKIKNSNRPTFYIQVSDFFFERLDHPFGVQVLSNILELDLENPELLKIVARRLMNEGEYSLAIDLYIEIRDLRPEEPQSYRDLAEVYSMDKQYQLALENYQYILDRNWGRFESIKELVFNEFNSLIALHAAVLDLNGIDESYIQSMPMDIRIVIDWSSNDNDIDLWVIDPNGEKCFYSHKETALGGKISTDITGGYGPEEFSLKSAKSGTYTVYVDYYSESRQTITGPVTIYANLYTNYGSKGEEVKKIALQLEKTKETLQIGQLEFNKTIAKNK